MFEKIWEKVGTKILKKYIAKQYDKIMIKIYNEINQSKLSHLSHHIGMYTGNPYTSTLIFISSVKIFPQR